MLLHNKYLRLLTALIGAALHAAATLLHVREGVRVGGYFERHLL